MPGRVPAHIAGFFSNPGEPLAARAAGALNSCELGAGEELLHGPLSLALSDKPPTGEAAGVLCRVLGPLFERERLAADLGLDPACAPARLVAGAYARWGRDALARLRGEALIILWDPAVGRGFIARDALGARSLVYARAGERLAFASELAPLLRLLDRRPAASRAGVALWIARDATRPELTLLEGVSRLPSGWLLELDESTWRPARWWNPAYVTPTSNDHAAAAEEIRPALLRAVERRLPADGAAAVMLSGGLDSTSVAGAAAHLRPGDVRGYSAVFPGRPQIDESPWIDALTSTCGLPSTRLAAQPQGLVADTLESIASWSTPPLGFDFFTAPLWRQAAADGATVLMTGDGGDEVFSTRMRLLEDRLTHGRVLSAVQLARGVPGLLVHPPWRPVIKYLRDFAVPGPLARRPAFNRLARVPPQGDVPWLDERVRREVAEATAPDAWRALDGPRWWADAIYHVTVRIDALGMPDDVRRSGDEVGVAGSMPLLDQDLLEVVLRQPPELGFGPLLGKPLLRAAVAGLVPDSVRMRPLKTVFSALLVDALHGPDRALVEQLLRDPVAESRGFTRGGAPAGGLLDDPPPRTSPAAWYWAQDVWRLTLLECWLRELAEPGWAAKALDRLPVPPRRFELSASSFFHLDPAAGAP